jgi:2-oxo-4-hydroxy-4-carboxy--5-ureidoimidazoline (OHCU) decarboxylase
MRCDHETVSLAFVFVAQGVSNDDAGWTVRKRVFNTESVGCSTALAMVELIALLYLAGLTKRLKEMAISNSTKG